ncbi:Hsp70 nucleotide exchange factor [Pseudomassariella vexata]|uniref:Hsp70 nucleotide exchange factor n=1 Tax=Pseudomassariella vexata TaxID=1141098 RepID=A0A1Y2EJ55_9PEZI|nr:Hsp70 nucleotide exchange factor [Pseudomassariella vexata]ORY71608.1 Hsp70 nucleotide exchange factor [Pseudomassariella vexata]
MDRNLNELLKWGIENSTEPIPTTAAEAQQANPSPNGLNQEILAALMGGPSDADLMKAAVENITSSDPEITLESKLIAFDNLEQLIESLDNANLLAKLGLWTPLLELLGHDEAELRLMAAWCIGTAVQNNEPCQERLVALGGVERLCAMALGDRAAETKDVRRKAVYALSSACRNYQPAMDVLSSELAKREGKTAETGQVDATNMDAVDVVINGLREKALSA